MICKQSLLKLKKYKLDYAIFTLLFITIVYFIRRREYYSALGNSLILMFDYTLFRVRVSLDD